MAFRIDSVLRFVLQAVWLVLLLCASQTDSNPKPEIAKIQSNKVEHHSNDDDDEFHRWQSVSWTHMDPQWPTLRLTATAPPVLQSANFRSFHPFCDNCPSTHGCNESNYPTQYRPPRKCICGRSSARYFLRKSKCISPLNLNVSLVQM